MPNKKGSKICGFELCTIRMEIEREGEDKNKIEQIAEIARIEEDEIIRPYAEDPWKHLFDIKQ